MSKSTATQQDYDDAVAILLSGDDDLPRHGLRTFVFEDPGGRRIDVGQPLGSAHCGPAGGILPYPG